MKQEELSLPRAYLIALQTPELSDAQQQDSLDELGELAGSAGYEVAGRLVQTRERMKPGTVFGAGKIDDIRAQVGDLQADLVIFDGNLTPMQGQHLEKALHLMVLDRTQLILDIFGRNANTREARLQVELAQLEYMLPRLVGMWAHLDRERGGIGGSKGPGEKQIDIDRSLIRSRIARLRKDLRGLAQERSTQKKRRANCFKVSLVGYTNAGKTTLMNRLTDTNLTAADRLFATLDSTTRALDRESQPTVLLSDTVGFIRRLPHELVASFRSTLEVARDADLLLQVVDLSHENYEEHIETTNTVLEEIGADTVPRLIVFNKVDRVENRAQLLLARSRHPEAVFVNATGDDMGPLKDRIAGFFRQSMVTAPLLLAYADYGELHKIYRWSRVEEMRYEQDGIHLTVTSTPANLERIRANVPVEGDGAAAAAESA